MRVANQYGENWLRMYVGRKLRTDPVFQVIFELLRNSSQPLIDLGCGVGLLAFYLRERAFQNPIRGVDCDGRKVTRANSVAAESYHDVRFTNGDAASSFSDSGDIVISDLLHYLSPNDQLRVLKNVAHKVAPDGILIIRDCLDDGSIRFRLTHFAERFSQATSWNVKKPLHFPTRESILAAFDRAEFTPMVKPLWGRTPFNNHLFVFKRRAAATAPAPAKRSDTLRE